MFKGSLMVKESLVSSETNYLLWPQFSHVSPPLLCLRYPPNVSIYSFKMYFSVQQLYKAFLDLFNTALPILGLKEIMSTLSFVTQQDTSILCAINTNWLLTWLKWNLFFLSKAMINHQWFKEPALWNWVTLQPLMEVLKTSQSFQLQNGLGITKLTISVYTG